MRFQITDVGLLKLRFQITDVNSTSGAGRGGARRGAARRGMTGRGVVGRDRHQDRPGGMAQHVTLRRRTAQRRQDAV